jgi:hypothetical protein
MASRLPISQTLQSAIAIALRRCRPKSRSIVAVALSASLSLIGSPDAAAANTYVVNSTADSGTGSLREAISLANGSFGNTVTFSNSLNDSTITLTTGDISITQAMAIEGPGMHRLTISGGSHSRIFYSHATLPGQFNISGLTLTGGKPSSGAGGAILGAGSYISLNDVAISASAAINGGGVAVFSGGLFVSDSKINGNLATLDGGGIYTKFSILTIDRSTIAGNNAGVYGGGIYASYVQSLSFLRIEGSTISGNVIPQPSSPTNQGGGGIALAQVSGMYAHIEDSTIANNYAFDNGAGILLRDATTAAKFAAMYSTIAGNSSAGAGGNGITCASGTAHVDASIISGNFSRDGISDLSGTFYLGRSLVQSTGTATITAASTGNIFFADPLLSILADHGGPTLTMLPALNSSAIDATLPCDIGLSSDQRGLERCVNGLSDMGAVERQRPEDVIFRDGFNAS